MIDSRFLTSRDPGVNGDVPLTQFDPEASAKTFNDLARKVFDLYNRHATSQGTSLRWGLKHVDINNQAPEFLGSQVRQFLRKILYLTPTRPGERLNVSISPWWLLCSPGELFGEDLAEVIDDQITYIEHCSPTGCLEENDLEAVYMKKEKYFVLFDHPFETYGSGLWINVHSANVAEIVVNRNRPLAMLSKEDVVWKPLQPILESWLAAMNRDDWNLSLNHPLLREPYFHRWQVDDAVAAFHNYMDLVASKVKEATASARGQRLPGRRSCSTRALESIAPVRPFNRYVCMRNSFYGEEWNEGLASSGTFAREFLSRIDSYNFKYLAPGLEMLTDDDLLGISDVQNIDGCRILFRARGYQIDRNKMNGHANLTNGASNGTLDAARPFLQPDQVNRVCQQPGIYSLSGDRESFVYIITEALVAESGSSGTTIHPVGRSTEGRRCILPASLPELFRLFTRNINEGKWTVGPDGVNGCYADIKG